MTELQESLLATTLEMLAESLHQVAQGMELQSEAINRLAESNEALAAVVYQSVIDVSDNDMPAPTYLSGATKG